MEIETLILLFLKFLSSLVLDEKNHYSYSYLSGCLLAEFFCGLLSIHLNINISQDCY